jgi:hypothetical protein
MNLTFFFLSRGNFSYCSAILASDVDTFTMRVFRFVEVIGRSTEFNHVRQNADLQRIVDFEVF